MATVPESLYHLALAGEWEAAVAAGESYRRSTIGHSLDDVGYIHCSFGHQVQRTADAYYAGRDDVVLLTVDPARLSSEVRVEMVEGAGEEFPHVYGPLDLDAVVSVLPLVLRNDGSFELPIGT